MTFHEEKAAKFFLDGYNCAQAVFMAYSDLTSIDEETSAKMASSFGGGLARLREVCGAVSGMSLAASCLFGYSDPNDPDAKKDHYSFVSDLCFKFKEEMGSYICKELLALPENSPYNPNAEDRTQAFYTKRPCVECVKYAARLLDEAIDEKRTNKIK